MLVNVPSYAQFEFDLSGVSSALIGKKGTKIKLTGTLNEPATVTVGNTGEKIQITSLPFEFRVPKNSLPLTLNIHSDNYTYKTINIPKKPYDDVGHIYLVKGEIITNNSIAQQVRHTEQQGVSSSKANQNTESEIQKSLDKTKNINNAPITNKQSENTFALIIANEEYMSASNVDMATYDGLAIKEYCEKTLGLSKNQIVYSPNSTYGSMKKAIGKIKAIASAFDNDMNLIFYYAGHGIPDNATKDAYLMPVDADGTDISVCYSLKNLYQEFDEMNINQTVVFLDACFSGAKRDGDMVVAARGVAIKPKEAEPTGNTIVFSATSDEEAAYSYKEEQHGLFTYYLLKIMQEKKGEATLGDIADFISKNVKRNSILINGTKQTPSITAPKSMGNTWESLKLTGKK